MSSERPAEAGVAPADNAEAAPPPPPEEERAFGAALPLATRFAGLLATDGVERGLLGPREVPRLWERHLLNCAVVVELIPADAEAVDVGSGAGLPGLIIAMLRPSVPMILLEPMLRRTVFLEECVAALGLDNVTVHRSRAEDAAGTLHADVATSRAVAPLDRLLPRAARGIPRRTSVALWYKRGVSARAGGGDPRFGLLRRAGCGWRGPGVLPPSRPPRP